jgi:hypothetical protein
MALFAKSCYKYSMIRPLCKACNKNYAAANYWRDGIRHYRSRCESCIRKNRGVRATEPRWKTNGYTKKTACDLCGFKSRYPTQITVHHIDGNLNNTVLTNLRSICLNCCDSVRRTHTTWKVGDLEVDR